MKAATKVTLGAVALSLFGLGVLLTRDKPGAPPTPSPSSPPGDGEPGTTFVAWFSYTGASGMKRWIQVRQYGEPEVGTLQVSMPTGVVMTRASVEGSFQWLISLSDTVSTPLAQGDIATEGTGYSLDMNEAIADAREEAIRKVAEVAAAWIDAAFPSEDE